MRNLVLIVFAIAMISSLVGVKVYDDSKERADILKAKINLTVKMVEAHSYQIKAHNSIIVVKCRAGMDFSEHTESIDILLEDVRNLSEECKKYEKELSENLSEKLTIKLYTL